MNRKMLVLVALMLSVVALPAKTQDRFRVDFDHISIYNPSTDKWSEWEQVNHTFVFNINNNKDIMHYRANGNRVTYRNISGAERNKTSDGKEYQITTLLDADGEEFLFQLFDDTSIGVIFTFQSGIRVQFASADN